MLDDFSLILAQEGGAPPPNVPGGPAVGGDAVEGQSGAPSAGDGDGGAPSRGPGGEIWFFLLAIIAVMWIFMFSSQRKEKKKRATMLATMAKGSKVQTVGGVLGTVVEIRDDEVVVKVDENANIRLRFARSAIQAVLEEAKE